MFLLVAAMMMMMMMSLNGCLADDGLAGLKSPEGASSQLPAPPGRSGRQRPTSGTRARSLNETR